MGAAKKIGQRPDNSRHKGRTEKKSAKFPPLCLREIFQINKRYESSVKAGCRNCGAGNGFNLASIYACKAKNVVKPFPKIDFSEAVEIGNEPIVSTKKLLAYISKIDGHEASVLSATKIIRNENNKKKLHAALGYDRPEYFHTKLGCMVAVMNLYGGIANDMRRSDENHIKLNEEKQRKRVVPVIAAMLQEFVAYNAISLETVKEEFGEEVAKLTDELSRKTRLPIGLSLPDKNGKQSVFGFRDNNLVSEYGRELMFGASLSGIIYTIKTIDALQQLRVIDTIDAKDSENNQRIKTELCMHIQGMYLPWVKISGQFKIAEEMQGIILHQLDPHSEQEIKEKLAAMSIEEVRDQIYDMISKKVAENEFDLEAEIIKSIKHPWSIWQKLLHNEYGKTVDEVSKLLLSLKNELEKGNIDEEKYWDELDKIKADQNNNPIPEICLDKVDMSKIKDIVRFKIIIKDGGSYDEDCFLCDKINDLICETFTISGDIEEIIKQNGYHSFHMKCTRNDDPNKLEFEFQVETQGMNFKNSLNHSFYKASTFSEDPGHSNEPQEPFDFKSLYKIVANTIDRLVFGVDKKNCNNPFCFQNENKYIYVCRKEDGFPYRLKKGAQVKDLLKVIHWKYNANNKYKVSFEDFKSAVKWGFIEGGKEFYADLNEFFTQQLSNADVVSFNHPLLDRALALVSPSKESNNLPICAIIKRGNPLTV